jgi:hypothetical protein
VPYFTRSSGVALLILVLAASAAAQTPASGTSALADSSALVVTGRVEQVGAQADGGAIYTYVTVSVAETLKGPGQPGTIVVKQLGGVLPDLGLFIAGQARFAVGEDVLLFLAVRPRDGSLYTVGLSEGKWQVLPDLQTGAAVAVNADRRVVLDAAVRADVASSERHETAFEAVPLEWSRAADFTFIPPEEGGPARWHEADDNGRIPVDYQTIPGGLPGGGSNQLDAALGAWNGVGTRLQLDRAASGSAVCPSSRFTGNGRIALYWDDPCGEVSDSDATTFGVGGGFFTPGFQKTINGVVFNKFLQGLAILNNVGPHRTTAACLQDAVTHVLGHALGLGHSSSSTAVMFATLRSSCSGGSTGLGGDDIDGLRFIYPPVASGGTAPHAPTAITNSVVLDTVTLSWTPAATGGPATSYILEAGTAPGLANITTITLNSSHTSTVVGAVPAGLYYVRVRARNALGTSLPSPDTAVTVGACSAPGVPTNFTYTTADNLVTLTWAPPATGVTQGYWLYAGLAPGRSDALVTALGPEPSFSGPANFGTYFVRIAARNTCAVGPVTTPDLQVVVQPCTTAPNPATGLAFSRNGNLVTLTWNRPASGNLPSRYVIHAGSAPGASDLLVFPTGSPATTFTASAGPGTYYVRVVGQNNCGLSGASNEIAVVVP